MPASRATSRREILAKLRSAMSLSVTSSRVWRVRSLRSARLDDSCPLARPWSADERERDRLLAWLRASVTAERLAAGADDVTLGTLACPRLTLADSFCTV